MIGGDTDVSCAALQHRQHRTEDATNGTDFLAFCVARRRHGKEVTKEFVGAVDEVDVHGYFLAVLCTAAQTLRLRSGRGLGLHVQPTQHTMTPCPRLLPSYSRLPD